VDGSRSGQHFLERFDQHAGIHAGSAIGICVGPLLCRVQRVELGDHQAATEACRAWVVTVDGRVWPGQQQATFLLQLFQAGEVSGAGSQAIFQGVFDVVAMMA